MQVAEDQNHSGRLIAAIYTNNQSIEDHGEKANRIASISLKGEMDKSLCTSKDDKENSLPNCSDHQQNGFQEGRAKTSTPRVKALLDSPYPLGKSLKRIPDNDRTSLVGLEMDISECNEEAENSSEAITESGCKSIFNWDDVDVGNFEANHSQNFFARNHLNHERRCKIKLANELIAPSVVKNEIQNSYSVSDITKIGQNTSDSSPTPLRLGSLDNDHNLQSTNSDEYATVDRKTQSLDETVKPQKNIRPNIAAQWSSQKVVLCKTAPNAAAAAALKSMPPPPRAYVFKDLYERKRQESIRRLLDEERQKRVFHSRPMPNFNAYHKQLEQKVNIHAITMPVTPEVLKHSRQSEENRRKKLEEWKKQNRPVKFESREANVLKEDPFIPKKSQTSVQTRPFNLRSEHRLQDRKKYDAATKHALEEKQKQEEERRKTVEEKLVKELRKVATFKARPNPFK